MSVAGRKGRYASDINVTPFVDVMLGLLIIFMVTAPMMTEVIGVDLPRTRTVEALPVDDDHIVVGVGATGMVFLDEQRVALEDLTSRLRGHMSSGQKEVFRRGGRTAGGGRPVTVRAADVLVSVSAHAAFIAILFLWPVAQPVPHPKIFTVGMVQLVRPLSAESPSTAPAAAHALPK